MKPTASFSSLIRAAACGALLLALSPVVPALLHGASKPAAGGSTSSLAEQLVGTWIRVGEPGKVVEPPAKGGALKHRTSRHWVAVGVDPRSALVASAHGGTWRVTGNEYEESIEYGGEHHATIIGKTYKWTVKLEGDLMTMTAIGNPWNEVWKRVK
jgi:hypothetical protein